MNRLEVGHRLYVIYKSIGNWLLYVCDLYFDCKLGSVGLHLIWFMN